MFITKKQRNLDTLYFSQKIRGSSTVILQNWNCSKCVSWPGPLVSACPCATKFTGKNIPAVPMQVSHMTKQMLLKN